jgi:nucleoside-diphosphate-sugar epimerase
VPGYESVISIFHKQFKNNQPLTVTGDGSQERMFTYVGDVVDGLIKSWNYQENDEFDLVNPIKSYKILEIAKMFSNNIVFVQSRNGDRAKSDPQNYIETCNKLNWEPKVGVEQWIEENK